VERLGPAPPFRSSGKEKARNEKSSNEKASNEKGGRDIVLAAFSYALMLCRIRS